MSELYHVGDVPAVLPSFIKHISHASEVEALSSGEIVEFYGYVVRWDDDCVSSSLCATWRTQGDPLCDAALEDIFPNSSASVGKDLLEALETYVAAHSEERSAARAFLDEVSRVPPTDLEVKPEEAELARELFLDNAVQIMQALLHYSLAGGFASPRIVRTLQAVSYLVPHTSRNAATSVHITDASNDRTFSRLLETLQFVLDVLGCTTAPKSGDAPSADKDKGARSTEDPIAYLLPGGEGWRSAVRVRMLHGVARRRVRERWKREGREEEEIEGIPISQEDMSATLASFSTVPMWCLRRLHLPPAPASERAYLALWRHVGFYLGVDPHILTRYFLAPHTADKFLASTALQLFSPSLSSPASGPGPTLPIMHAVSHRPPSNASFAHNVALTRHLLGASLSEHLALPEVSWLTYLHMRVNLLVQAAFPWFGRLYPRAGWRDKRRALLREGIPRSLRWQLGMRRVTFRPRTDVAERGAAAAKITPEGEEGAGKSEGAELGPGVKEAESVSPDPARAQVLVRQWREVLLEMFCVCAGVGVAVAWTGWYGTRLAFSSL
ncbi:hypothetical protein CERSUDRAFT_116818 [Gelatoporia subvermispora B]|uniref:ER-bound oxygenase mpaB/mpaB'/Rubber oxygenase catalytic domain-containing protein n=1 Tax=Ceriporiopsis subvermispora (strain B) TaxID=914234 RepID=M2R7H9_CERS8|nr:hypothetical protein CERSUDRAFT_116818 [Gelatoporia subvermispora B]